MARLLVVLQCAYATTPRHRRQLRDNRFWERALWRSHTGRRLAEMLPEAGVLEVINASPEIGARSDAAFPPDPAHIREHAERFRPDVILACGAVAQRGVRDAGLEYVTAPHPAWRALSKERAQQVREQVARGLR